mgnify:CR=1 FL=1
MLKKSPNPNNAVEEIPIPTGKLSFRDYIQHGISRSRLQDGEYHAQIIGIQFIQNETDPEKDHLRLEIQLDFDSRVIVENRFASGYFLFERQIKEQLDLADTSLPVSELLSTIKNQPIKIWLKTQIGKDGRTYQNVHFAKPEVSDDEEEMPKF